MKKLTVLLMGLVISGALMAQAKPKDWKELAAFHDVMSETFHPAEEGKLDPIKSRSGEMVAAAKEWKKSTPPAEFNKPEIQASLDKLVKGSKELDKMVKNNASDPDLTKKLTDLHDVFHEIVGLCKDAH